MTDFYSLTGKRIYLKDASDETLAEVLDGLEAELKDVRERISLVAREIARRMGKEVHRRAGAWDINLRHIVNVKRVVSER